MTDNPFFSAWSTPFAMPPFADITVAHFRPAFERALASHRAAIEAIVTAPGVPTFADTIEALELSDVELRRVGHVFFNLTGAHTSPELQEIEREIAPKLAKHRTEILLDKRLYDRIAALQAKADSLGLDAEQARVLERCVTMLRRAGAHLDPASKSRLSEISQRLASLGTQFSQNVLADEQSYRLVLEGEADLAGLPDFGRRAAAATATELGLDGKHVITLARSSIEPFLKFSARRDLREKAFRAWSARGANGDAHDNRAIVKETLLLRAERARLLGFPSFAHFKLDDTMAQTPEAARELLMGLWGPAVERAGEECAELQALAGREGANERIEPWDWHYYSEKVRKAKFDIDEGEIKPYLPLDQVIAAAFDTARRLFSVEFSELEGLPVYHPDVRVFEVKGSDGRHVGLFLADYFARPSKRSGAWMSSYRSQSKLGGEQRPIIVNVMNFVKGSSDVPTLLSFDDARTLFHEFGHALHGLLSDVRYAMIAGTSVARDFVELPSQLYEHWLLQPEVLARFARHYETGQPMPVALIERLQAARNFNQGFASVEYTASALVDLDLHLATDAKSLDLDAYERQHLQELGMPAAITMRHRIPHFAHVFSGDGYSAGYYSYLWSELMDADAFLAFEEAGDIFDPALARRLREFIYSAGNRQEPADAYIAFRGRLPTIDALLAKRGLARKRAA
ncbi:MAG: M3 family metallopeptidase [Hyphomicrobiaceae bacterium]